MINYPTMKKTSDFNKKKERVIANQGMALEDMINRTRKAIRAHADREDQDFQLSYSHDFTGDIDRIRKDHFDLAGNDY